ncbi:CBS domain-containing protein [Pustulibacterium marinum]|uniref:CBS domain-containing protein n=1 Tax=Pustulibacterium marinum TaxID=1224947 RepID=A0A1I7HL85_9FLAO|nr:CBS domain-containing protein [Pustulibacterium marinum]SFU61463.1 CBS domain-containing protein [Pustulibacterium marinum]
MKVNEPVSEIMTTNLVLLNTDDSLDKAERLFKKHHIRHIPVVKGHRVVGMLSLTDLLRISFADLTEDEEEVETIVYNMFTIEQVMAKTPLVVTPNQSIKEVAEILATKEFHALPVVAERKKIVGIVTTTDLLKYLLEQYKCCS